MSAYFVYRYDVTMKVAVIGIGYWGPNVLRNFVSLLGVDSVIACDSNVSRLEWAVSQYPGIEVLQDSEQVFSRSDIRVVAVCTPLDSHFSLVKKALLAKKHVFVEKPLVNTCEQCDELSALAKQNDCIVMVDHPQLYSPGFEAFADSFKKETLGNLLYMDIRRSNLGRIQPDCNVIWDLAVHDMALLYSLLPLSAQSLSVSSQHCLSFKNIKPFAQRASVNILFEKNVSVSMHFNWLSPIKERVMLLAGDKKMLYWNELDSVAPIKCFDSSVSQNEKGELLYHQGAINTPTLENHEPLKKQLQVFLQAVSSGVEPVNSFVLGRKVTQFLQACDRSIDQNGKTIALDF